MFEETKLLGSLASSGLSSCVHPAAYNLIQRQNRPSHSPVREALSQTWTRPEAVESAPAADQPAAEPASNSEVSLAAEPTSNRCVVQTRDGDIDPDLGHEVSYKGLIFGRDEHGLHVYEDQANLCSNTPRLNRTYLPEGKTYLQADYQIWLGPAPRYGIVYDLNRGEFLSVVSRQPKRAAEVSLAGKLVEIRENGIIVGRHHEGTVDMEHPLVRGVSRDHAILRRDSSGIVWIEDISTRGTWVNGKRIAKGIRFPLGPSDTVNLGQQDGPTIALHRVVYDLVDYALNAS